MIILDSVKTHLIRNFIDTVRALSVVSLSPDRAFAQLLIVPNQNPVQFKTDMVVLLIYCRIHNLLLNVKQPLEP